MPGEVLGDGGGRHLDAGVIISVITFLQASVANPDEGHTQRTQPQMMSKVVNP
jgi:hypothetical protein